MTDRREIGIVSQQRRRIIASDIEDLAIDIPRAIGATTAGAVLLWDANGDVLVQAPGTKGEVLVTQGAGAVATWEWAVKSTGTYSNAGVFTNGTNGGATWFAQALAAMAGIGFGIAWLHFEVELQNPNNSGNGVLKLTGPTHNGAWTNALGQLKSGTTIQTDLANQDNTYIKHEGYLDLREPLNPGSSDTITANISAPAGTGNTSGRNFVMRYIEIRNNPL